MCWSQARLRPVTDTCIVVQIMRLIRVAERKVKELSEMLQASLKAHDVERVQARIRRHNLTPAVSQAQSRAVTVLTSSDIVGTLRSLCQLPWTAHSHALCCLCALHICSAMQGCQIGDWRLLNLNLINVFFLLRCLFHAIAILLHSVLNLQHGPAGKGSSHQPMLDSGSDESDMLSTSQSESADEGMASDEEEAGSQDGKADVEMASTSGDVLSYLHVHNLQGCPSQENF